MKAFSDQWSLIGKTLVAIATETEKTAERFCRENSHLDNEGRYFRFNVLRGLEGIGLEDSKQKNAIIAATSRYIESQAVFKQIKACASILAGRNVRSPSPQVHDTLPDVESPADLARLGLDSGPYHVNFSLKGVPIVRSFVERAAEMEQLENALLPSTINWRRKIMIVQGLGGIGKTQLTVEFARRHNRHFSAVFWIDGRSHDSLRRSLAAVAKRLPNDEILEQSRSYTHGTNEELDAVIHDVLSWPSVTGNASWLLIFDNVDRDVTNTEDLEAYDIMRYVPDADHGSILITTRLARLAQMGKLLPLTTVNDEQAMSILECFASSALQSKSIPFQSI